MVNERKVYGLTEDEHKAIELTADLWNLLCSSVVEDGPSRAGDLAELCTHIHAIQRAVMAQAAGRVYPELYRLLGSVIQPDVIDAHPWQEYNAHGNTCQYPGCRLAEDQHPDWHARRMGRPL